MNSIKKEKAVFGIIGAGGFAQNQHLPNLDRSTNVELKTVCDLNEDTLGRMQKKYGIPSATADYKELLADPGIQAVVVATRDDMQAPLTIEALKAGKHVYVEKPLAETPEGCNAVAEAQKAAGRFVAVGFNRRFAPAYRKAKEFILAHGGATNIHYRISDDYWNWSKQYDFPPGVRIIHEVCHIFDIIRWFTDSDAESVYCVESRPDDEIITIKMKSGCVVSVMDSGFVSYDLPKERLEVVVDKGGVVVEDFVELRTYGDMETPLVERFIGHSHPDFEFAHKYLLEKIGAEGWGAIRRSRWEMEERGKAIQDGDEFPDRPELEYFQNNTAPCMNYMIDKGWFHALDHFAQCVLSGKQPENAGAGDGLAASRIVHAAMESRASGQPVVL